MLAARYRALHGEVCALFDAAADIDDPGERAQALAAAQRDAAPLIAQARELGAEQARRARRLARWMRGCAWTVGAAGLLALAWLSQRG